MNVVRVKQLKHQLCIVIYGNVRFEEPVLTIIVLRGLPSIFKQNLEPRENNLFIIV